MVSSICREAISDAQQHGRALLRFITANDVGLTGGHQYGFYLPRPSWKLYTPQSPENGINHKHEVGILWKGSCAADPIETQSVVTWYGKETRSEYRLTRFGRDFPFLKKDRVGNLLLLVPVTLHEFHIYVFDSDEDMDAIQEELGALIPNETWGRYGHEPESISQEDRCVDRHFEEFTSSLDDFPTTQQTFEEVRDALMDCMQGFGRKSADRKLLQMYEIEDLLFRRVEQHISPNLHPKISTGFSDVEEFCNTAKSILNRRASRAGWAFENHVTYVLEDAGVPFEYQPDIDGRPDLVIPNAKAYCDNDYPIDRLFVVGIKTTCKERWRQVLDEGRRVQRKHLITLDSRISSRTLDDMADKKISLILPEQMHRNYPQDSAMELMSVRNFIDEVQRVHPA